MYTRALLLWNLSVSAGAIGGGGGGDLQIEVVFTSSGESADMYVERLTEELKDAGCPNVMVSYFFVYLFVSR